ncbi:VanZ family protein [Neobacillus sp. PS2-9]|uniref:VanZ family protein n=1 Tax=Neobacillus sp. PS2-9 TaxID=3070676 RepID=UPI0027DECFFE|nr:VanZ family protein [Neobacillus sp. PS2-9]WML55895.1 VanZ family protein [Neobacillus sp. PS2-9]
MKKSYILSLFLSIGTFLIFSPVLFQLTSYLHPVVLVVVWFCIYMFYLISLLLIRKETIQLSYSLFLTFILFYTIGLLILLFLRPNDQSYESINLIPFSTIAFYLSGKVDSLISLYNLAANIGLFLPFGILLRTSRASLRKLIVLPFTAITFIELLQFFTHRGSLDIDDLLLNLLGIYAGCWLYPLFRKIVKIPSH